MDVLSFCHLRAGSLRWQPRLGAHALTVICKATFELRPEESPLAATQDALTEADTLGVEGSQESLQAASDLVPFKRAADVLVIGRAHAPRGQAVASLVARVSVGTMNKALQVRAEQGWVVAGLGPLAPTSTSRVAMLGRHAAVWDHRTWNTSPLPDDVNGAFFNAAPVDQQLAELRGDELIALDHLHPEHARLVTRLARVVPRATVRRGDQVQEVRLRCDTLMIDADRGRATLVWRGVVLLAHEAEQGLVAVTAEGAKTLEVDDVEATMTIIAPSGKNATRAPVLPFASGTVSALRDEEHGETRAQDVAPHAPVDDATRTLIGGLGQIADVAAKQVLPFVPGTAPLEIASGSAARSDEELERKATGTMFLRGAPTEPALPFAPSQEMQQIAPAVPATPVRPALAREVQAEDEEPVTPRKDRAPEEEALHARADPFDVAPPPMLGPLAGVKIAGEKQIAGAPIVQTAALVQPEGDVIAPAPVALPEPEPIELTIEQVAGIAAELAEGKVERRKVLEVHGLRERGWRENERRWTLAIEDESARGMHGLRGKYDAAYVARVEGFRGPIKLEEYARVVSGLERGQASGVLDALRIQQAALMPIVRLWTRKVAQDMKLGDAATLAIRAARRA